MKYRGFVIVPHFAVGSDFNIRNGVVIARKQTKKDIEYYDILDPIEDMRKYCSEGSVVECKAEIDRLLLVLNMESNNPSDWEKLDK